MQGANISFYICASNQLKAKTLFMCQAVSEHFEDSLNGANSSVLCLIDDSDSDEMRYAFGATTRGLHIPMFGQGLAGLLPVKFWEIVMPHDPHTGNVHCPFCSVIYLHGSTAANDFGLTLTLAHELQHALQYATQRRAWVLDNLFHYLGESGRQHFQCWWDYPTEKDARLKAKKIAQMVFGARAVDEYLRDQAQACIHSSEAQDYLFVLDLDTSLPYDMAAEVAKLAERFREQLPQATMTAEKDGYPFSRTVDLSAS